MPEFIIFLTIVSVIVNIVKAISKSKLTQQAETGTSMTHGTETGKTLQSNIDRRIPKYTIKSENLAVSRIHNPQERIQPKRNNSFQGRVDKDATAKTKHQVRISTSNLTPNRLIEGIIFSEILAPPKSRRIR